MINGWSLLTLLCLSRPISIHCIRSNCRIYSNSNQCIDISQQISHYFSCCGFFSGQTKRCLDKVIELRTRCTKCEPWLICIVCLHISHFNAHLNILCRTHEHFALNKMWTAINMHRVYTQWPFQRPFEHFVQHPLNILCTMNILHWTKCEPRLICIVCMHNDRFNADTKCSTHCTFSLSSSFSNRASWSIVGSAEVLILVWFWFLIFGCVVDGNYGVGFD